MVHTFEVDKQFYAYDVESGSLHLLDGLAFRLLKNDESVSSDFSAEEIKTAQAEIAALMDNGSLEGAAPENVALRKTDVVKSLCLHICHDCNLRCRYCFADEGAYKGKREMMSFETGKAAIDFLIRNSGNRKNLEIDFFGGEPLMNFEVLKHIVEYGKAQAAKCGKVFKFTTTTNGVLLTKKVSDYLNAEMDNVVLSLDGRKEVNDSVRKTVNGKGSFDIIKDNFLYFKSIRGDKSYFVRGTYTAENLDFRKDVLFLNDLGFDQISVEPVVLDGVHPLAITEKDLPALTAEYEALTKEYLDRRRTDKWFSFFHFVVHLEDGPCCQKRLTGCGAGGEYLAVSPGGEIYPCHQFVGDKNYLLGNVFESALDVINKAGFESCNILSKPACQGCWAKYHCGGGCNANAVHFENDRNVPHKIGCELMKKRLECALHVYAKESAVNGCVTAI
jgi:uncharacterized protein